MSKSAAEKVGEGTIGGAKIGAAHGALQSLLESGAVGIAAGTSPFGTGMSKSALAKWLLKQGLARTAKHGAIGAGLGAGVGALGAGISSLRGE